MDAGGRLLPAKSSPQGTPSAATMFRCFFSTAAAERVDGGFRFTGHKMFGSLAPVWTRYGLHAMWNDAEGGPKIVHAFLPRDFAGYRIVETWDTLGMRGTRERRRAARRCLRARQIRRADPPRRRRRTEFIHWRSSPGQLLGFGNMLLRCRAALRWTSFCPG